MSHAIHTTQTYSIPAPKAGSLSRHLPAIVAFSLFILIATWLVTRGTSRLMDAEEFSGFYDAQAQSLMEGHWDIPREAVRPEAFIRDGKCYGYFGFVPALLRMPLIKLWPDTAGHWSRVSILTGCALGVVYGYLLLLRLGSILPLDNKSSGDQTSGARAAAALFVLIAGLGSTTIFLTSRSFPHHEALAWGATFAIASFYHLIGCLSRPRRSALVLASVFAFGAFFSRASVGAGPVLALSLLAANILATRWKSRSGSGALARLLTSPVAALNRWRDLPPRSAAVICITTVVLICTTFVAVNYAKFRTLFEAAPLQSYEQMVRNPQRLESIDGKLMSVKNVRTTTFNYFRPDAIRIGRNFPWVYTTEDARVFSEAKLDLVEPYTSITTSMPALLMLSLLGLRLAMKATGSAGMRLDIPVLGALAGGLAVLPADAISQRYLHDFFPFLIVTAAIGFHAMLAIRRENVNGLMRKGWIVLGVLGIWLNMTFAVTYQRVIIWGVDAESRSSFQETAASVDRVISRRIWSDAPSLPNQ